MLQSVAKGEMPLADAFRQLKAEGQLSRTATAKGFQNRVLGQQARAATNPFVYRIASTQDPDLRRALLEHYKNRLFQEEYVKVLSELSKYRMVVPS
ncbi:MAG: hypothetical protein L0387_12430 [Acidobacteria bacterium]|nr:hypothetical protein [Acidobacteriota bacterium]MCI0622447.1 hypothetical protein [Acidobacteriota bacterium]MCI0722365.1 hypothetical protein [Acidobacteriota bacterium]